MEDECSMLENMVVSLSKRTQSGSSNQKMSINSSKGYFKEEDIVHLLIEDMMLGKQDFVPSNVGMEDDINHHVFH